MKVVSETVTLTRLLVDYRKASLPIGLVPTMGALHQGHISLIERAASENQIVVVSIFVNPTQFNNPDDLKKYPRTMDDDVQLLEAVDAEIVIFAPSPEELYSGNVVSRSYDFGGLEFEMEGTHRPGHFDGVGTVLSILFRAVGPDRAYFGEKDFQQLQIVRKLVQIEEIPVQIVGCPILREASGLAMSSRNKRLTKEQFEAAGLIHEVLLEVQKSFPKMSIPALRRLVDDRFSGHPLFELEYFEIADAETLKPAVRKNKFKRYRVFVAVFAGEVRLIDNMGLN